jgi:Zn-dependent peptidase ImmA (M78 family)
VNYVEDVYRQRFTAAHEAGHAFLDDDKDVVVSFATGDSSSLSEIRANTFAARFLMPPDSLQAIPYAMDWSDSKVIDWIARLKVSTAALAISLKDAGLVDDAMAAKIRAVKVPTNDKLDSELPLDLSPGPRARKETLLRRGLSDIYVGLCFEAYERNVITAARLAEMLLVSPQEVQSTAKLYGRMLINGD